MIGRKLYAGAQFVDVILQKQATSDRTRLYDAGRRPVDVSRPASMLWNLQPCVESMRASLRDGVRKNDRGAREHIRIGGVLNPTAPVRDIESDSATDLLLEAKFCGPLTFGLEIRTASPTSCCCRGEHPSFGG